jgi:hypothetical protein
VTEATKPDAAKSGAAKARPVTPQPKPADLPKVVGKGWGSVMIVKMPAAKAISAPTGTTGAATDKNLAQLMKVVTLLPKVSGGWGSGHLMAGTVFSALLTDDGRLVVGAVTPEGLYAALAAK